MFVKEMVRFYFTMKIWFIKRVHKIATVKDLESCCLER